MNGGSGEKRGLKLAQLTKLVILRHNHHIELTVPTNRISDPMAFALLRAPCANPIRPISYLTTSQALSAEKALARHLLLPTIVQAGHTTSSTYCVGRHITRPLT